MVLDDVLWAISPRVSREDIGIKHVQHGVLPIKAVSAGIWFRYGHPLPRVALPSGRLVVSDDVAARLRDWPCFMNRLREIVITDPDLDWRAWSIKKMDTHFSSFRGRYECDEPEEIVMPHAAMHHDGSINVDSFRGRKWRRQPLSQPYYNILGVNDLAPATDAAGRRLRGVMWSPSLDGIHRIPWLYENDVCVGRSVKAVLESNAWPDSIDFQSIPVHCDDAK